MSGEWTRRRHHCLDHMRGGDTGDVWRCDCGREWLVLLPGLVARRWWQRSRQNEAEQQR